MKHFERQSLDVLLQKAKYTMVCQVRKLQWSHCLQFIFIGTFWILDINWSVAQMV